ncbi:MAG: beta-galactosidase [Myxococcota bacterium]|nr:beta-galactosidase [Myxococcota bacterium]
MKPKRPAARPATRARSAGAASSKGRPAKRAGSVRLEDGALRIGDRSVPLLCGAVHYWRLERESWRAALTEVRALGLPIVETYVPWQTHELAPGDYDFGQRDPRKDIGAFLDLAAELGLYAFVRPGPHINSEMTWFGLPERIVYDKSIQARSPRQNPVVLGFPPRMFPVPSYASTQYHTEVGRWFDAVGAELGSRMWPNGPIVLLQVDNEATYWFRDAAYDADYHPDALAWWRKWIEKRHGTLAEVAAAHHREYRGWDDVRAPQRFDAESPEELPLHLDWNEFREDLTATALTRFKARMKKAGLGGVPTVHNLPLGEQAAPISTPRLEEIVDVVGLDYYHARREHRTVKRRTLFLAGTSRLPFSPEMGVGAPPWFTPLTHEDSLFCAMCSAAYGVRGMSLYMAVDRDRWYGAPIDAQGNPRLEAGAWKSFLHALTSVGFHRLERRVEVALVLPREYSRLSRATHLLGLLSPITLEAVGGTPVEACSEEDLGFAGPIQVLWWRMIARFAEALTAARVPYVYVDGDVPDERLEGIRVLIAPTYEYASVERWGRLCGFAARGGHVVYGPAMPALDESMRARPFEVPKHGRKVSIDTAQDAVDVVEQLVRELALERPFPAEPSPVETTVHQDEHGPRVLFVINPSAERVEAEVALPYPMALEDASSGERLVGDRTLALALTPYACRMLIVREGADDAGARATAGRIA